MQPPTRPGDKLSPTDTTNLAELQKRFNQPGRFLLCVSGARYHEAVSCIDMLGCAVFCTWIFSLDIDKCTGNTRCSCL